MKFGPLVAALVVALVVALRLWGIEDRSITQDESTMVLFAKGVLDRGYPFLHQNYADFIIATYELVPYPIAASMGAFGFSEFAVRLPAVCFAAGSSLLMLWFGTKLFSRSVGVLAALIFAVLPWAIYWGSNAFYPSQVQFFILLATIVMHRLITDPRPPPWVYYAMFATVVLSYFSWEGSGFVLPAFFLMLIVLGWGRWHWLKSAHAWTAASLIILVVMIQLTYRTVLREPYLGVILGRSDVSFAQVAFTSVGYDPTFYWRGLKSEAHLALAAALVFGLPWVYRSASLRFLYMFVILIYLFLTSALGYYALRYVYLTLPAMLLIAAAVSVELVNRLCRKVPFASQVLFRRIGIALITAVHIALASPWGIRPLEAMEELRSERPYELRNDMDGFSFRAIARAVQERAQPGDVIIVEAPFPYLVYTGSGGDYFLQGVTATSVFYNEDGVPFYGCKWLGNSVLRTRDDLNEVFLKERRVWLMSAPDGAARLSIGKDLYRFVQQKMELVYEHGDGRLYLWENPFQATAKR